MTSKSIYNVYVIELHRDVLDNKKFVKANPCLRKDKPCVYVGSTCLSPESRFEQHRSGKKSNRYAHKYGIRLRPRLYRNFQGFATRKEALDAEAKLAERLRRRGYAVWYG